MVTNKNIKKPASKDFWYKQPPITSGENTVSDIRCRPKLLLGILSSYCRIQINRQNLLLIQVLKTDWPILIVYVLG